MTVLLDITDTADGFSLNHTIPTLRPRLKQHDSKVLRTIFFNTGLGTTYALKYSLRKNSKIREIIYEHLLDNV
jgi:hypothetical protein